MTLELSDNIISRRIVCKQLSRSFLSCGAPPCRSIVASASNPLASPAALARKVALRVALKVALKVALGVARRPALTGESAPLHSRAPFSAWSPGDAVRSREPG